METFNFPYHSYALNYPMSSSVVQFGKGYQFASEPKAPDQIEFVLTFEAMILYATQAGEVDVTTDPELNMGRLINFYEEHRLAKKFIYPSALKGEVVVRFGDPLSFNMSKKGGGIIEPFDLKFILQP